MIPAPDGTVWFTEFFLNKIAHLDPKTKEITEYQDEGAAAGQRPSKHTIRMDPHGQIVDERQPVQQLRSADQEIHPL